MKKRSKTPQAFEDDKQIKWQGTNFVLFLLKNLKFDGRKSKLQFNQRKMIKNNF